jgi:hypothetical protein
MTRRQDTTVTDADYAEHLAAVGARHTFLALWVSGNGAQTWAGPFRTNTQAREAVPAHAQASLIVQPIAMTPGERREALPILDQLGGWPESSRRQEQ